MEFLHPSNRPHLYLWPLPPPPALTPDAPCFFSSSSFVPPSGTPTRNPCVSGIPSFCLLPSCLCACSSFLRARARPPKVRAPSPSIPRAFPSLFPPRRRARAPLCATSCACCLIPCSSLCAAVCMPLPFPSSFLLFFRPIKCVVGRRLSLMHRVREKCAASSHLGLCVRVCSSEASRGREYDTPHSAQHRRCSESGSRLGELCEDLVQGVA